MNKDVLTEILVHLPVQSLFRFRAVCKFWADVINSSYFRKLHTHNNISDDTVCLRVILSNVGIEVQHNTNPLISRSFEDLGLTSLGSDYVVLLYGPVRGLISIRLAKWRHYSPIVICNPFLGQLKVLPPLTTTSSCKISLGSIAVGFDEDYKVVRLSFCYMHQCLHAYVYSRRTDSWRELAFDNYLEGISTIKSRCQNGHFAHWKVVRMVEGAITWEILSLDMRNEVFKKTMLPAHKFNYNNNTIFAKDEHLFWRFDFSRLKRDKLVHIYESRCEGSKLCWMYLMSVEVPHRIGIIPRWRTGFVVIEIEWRRFVYDYRANKFVYTLIGTPSFIEYEGSFVSLEN